MTLSAVPGPRATNFFRYAALFNRDPIAGFERCRADFGDVFGFRVPKLVVLLASPQAVRHVFVDHRERYVRGESLAELRTLVGDGPLPTSLFSPRPHGLPRWSLPPTSW
jgi:cytochrome P450